MTNLPIPLQKVDTGTIYSECANDLTDKTALGYLDKVIKSSISYKQYVPKDVKHLPNYNVPDEDADKILKVYRDKFAKQGSIGRKYYEAIKLNANGHCPICGSGKLKNLDHFLPKSLYPLLCITPSNLIPTCRDCNMDKSDYFNTNYYLLPLNPYFDKMDDIWLTCSIQYKTDNTYDIIYRNGYDQSFNKYLWQKYETHIQVFDLNTTFSSRACEEMENCKAQYKKLLDICGKAEVCEALTDHRKSCEYNDKNSWASALYRELEKEIDNYCDWLANDI